MGVLLLNLLGLDTYHILTVHEDEHDFSIEAELMAPPSCCMHCGSGLLYKHERISRLIMDIPIRGKRVGIVLQQRRYRCRACNRSFFEQFPDVHAHHSMTVRLVNYIQQQACAVRLPALLMMWDWMSGRFAPSFENLQPISPRKLSMSPSRSWALTKCICCINLAVS
jgi:transposase